MRAGPAYDDAVSLALAVDLDLAKAVASSPEDDDALRRKAVAEYCKARGAGGASQSCQPRCLRLKQPCLHSPSRYAYRSGSVFTPSVDLVCIAAVSSWL